VRIPVLDYGKSRCLPADHIFEGRYGGAPLSTRMIELTIRRARNAAGILKPVTAMTLRHTYALQMKAVVGFCLHSVHFMPFT